MTSLQPTRVTDTTDSAKKHEFTRRAARPLGDCNPCFDTPPAPQLFQAPVRAAAERFCRFVFHHKKKLGGSKGIKRASLSVFFCLKRGKTCARSSVLLCRGVLNPHPPQLYTRQRVRSAHASHECVSRFGTCTHVLLPPPPLLPRTTHPRLFFFFFSFIFGRRSRAQKVFFPLA